MNISHIGHLQNVTNFHLEQIAKNEYLKDYEITFVFSEP